MLSVVPLAGHHGEVGTGLGAQIGDGVEAAVDVAQCRVKGYVEHVQLVVVAQQTLQEVEVAQGQGGQVVV